MGRIGIKSGLVRVFPADPDSNEPDGFTEIIDQNFSSKTLGTGWITRADWNSNWPDGTTPRAEIVNDGTAPYSTPTFLRFNWPTGGDQSPTKAERSFGASYRQIYLSVYFRHSSNWENNSSGTNKMFYIGTNNSPDYDGEIFFDFHNSEQIRFRNQQPEPDGPDRPPNVNTNPCTPGTWYHLEAVLRQSTGGTANGQVQWWINDVLQGNYSNVLYAATGDSYFDAINLDPVWGGGGTTSRAIYLDYDHMYISGLL